MIRIGFCPNCGAELRIQAYEACTQNIIWSPCAGKACYYRRISIKSSPDGFVMEPTSLRGKYVLTRKQEDIRF